MNRSQLRDIVELTGVSEVVTQNVLYAFIEVLGERLQKGEKLTLTGLGTFSLQEVAATKIRSIYTGEAMDIKSRKRIRFKPSAEFTATVLEKK